MDVESISKEVQRDNSEIWYYFVNQKITSVLRPQLIELTGYETRPDGLL